MFPYLTPGDYRGVVGRFHTVTWLQERLGLKPDGIYGPKTAAAVDRFQDARDIREDGVDQETWAALAPSIARPVSLFTDWRISPEGKNVELGKNEHNPDEVAEAIYLAGRCIGIHENQKEHGALTFTKGYSAQRQTGGKDDPKDLPWCMIFLSVITGNALGLGRTRADWLRHPFGEWFGAVAELETWTLAQPGLRRLKGPVPGALFTMGRTGSGSDPSTKLRAGHAGIVVAVDGNYIWTVEGNVDNRVKIQRRSWKGVRMFVCWWDDADLAAVRDFGG